MFRKTEKSPVNLRAVEVKVFPFKDKKIVPYVQIMDDYDSQEFNVNDAGFIRNDISQLARAQSQSEYEAMLRKLREMPVTSGIPDDMPIEDAIAMIRPRHMQTPSELELFATSLANVDMKRLNSAYAKAVKDIPLEKQSAVEPTNVES